jgi:hypothetical protein
MQNTYSYQLIAEQEGLQPSGLYIHEQMYIVFPSSLIPSSPGTAYHQMYVTWDCTGRVIDPSPAWNWLIVLA